MNATPKSLREALGQGLESPEFFDYQVSREKELDAMQAVVRDFIAQKLTAAKLRAYHKPLGVQDVQDLFDALVK